MPGCRSKHHSKHGSSDVSGLANTIPTGVRDRTFKSAEPTLPPNRAHSERACKQPWSAASTRSQWQAHSLLIRRVSATTRGGGMAGSHFSPGDPLPEGTTSMRKRSCPADIACSATPRRHRNSTTSTPISFLLPSSLPPAAKFCQHEKKEKISPNFTVPTALHGAGRRGRPEASGDCTMCWIQDISS